MYISYYIDDFLVFSFFFLSNWILMSYILFVIRSSKTPRLSSWRCRCCSQLAPSHYQKIMTRHMTLNDQLNSTLQFTYLILLYIDLVNIEYWPGRWCILTSYFFGIIKQLITFHSANMVKWRSLNLVLSVVRPDLGLRPRSSPTTSEYQVSGPSFFYVDLMESY